MVNGWWELLPFTIPDVGSPRRWFRELDTFTVLETDAAAGVAVGPVVTLWAAVARPAARAADLAGRQRYRRETAPRRYLPAPDAALPHNRRVTTQISAATARRFLAIRHLLAPPRALPASPESVMAVVDRLGSLQFDPLEVAGRNHDLVLQARIAGYRRGITDELLYGRRLLFEAYNKSAQPAPTRANSPTTGIAWEDARYQPDAAASGRAGAARGQDSRADLPRRDPRARPTSNGRRRSRGGGGPRRRFGRSLEALSVSGRLSLARREGIGATTT